MPGSKNRRVPDSNILDLRTLLAEESARRDRPMRRGRWRMPAGRKKPESLVHDPAAVTVDWSRWRREGLKFMVVVVMMAVPVVGVFGAVRLTAAAGGVETAARLGAAALQRGGTAMLAYDAVAAQRAFAEAETHFVFANRQLSEAVWSQTRIASRLPLVGKKIRAADAAIGAARDIAQAGSVLAGSLTGTKPPAEPGVTIGVTGITQASLGVLGPMLRQPQSFRQGLDAVVKALEKIAVITPDDVPAEYRETIRVFQQVKPYLTEPAGQGGRLADVLTALFAGDATKEFLLVFQNHDELRATGGFIGTFMMVKFEGGVIKVLDAPGTGPFDLSVQIPQTILPPQPLLAVAPYWTFHDANWFLDVPTSSNFLLDFYEQARGFKPDGIIYVTPGLVESLLRLTGPLRPEGYGVDITAENFVRASEEQVEFKYNRALNNPKQFILDLVPVLINALGKLSAPEALLAVGVTLQHADQADLLFYSRHQEAQSAITALGWSGELIPAVDDYLAVVTSNLGGGKTDRVIDERVDVTVTPESRGLVHRVVVTRRHNGTIGDPLTGLRNKSFIRVYAPSGAQFIEVNGSTEPEGLFLPAQSGAVPTNELVTAEGTVLTDQTGRVRITNETNRKTFGAWSVIAVGETQTITFLYSTPLPDDGRWSMVWQKQPGAPRRNWRLTWESAPDQPIREVLNGGKIVKGQAVWETNSDLHRTFGVVFDPK